jgi:chemotaxis protein methyltransferase CheR
MSNLAETTDRAEDLDDIEIDLLLRGIARRYGYDFRNYSPPSLKRRIYTAVETFGVRSISALIERVLHHPDELGRFLAVLSVHATGLFRDPDFFLALRRRVVPMLRTYPFVRIWHAGCSTGEEVYSLAILLQEEGLYDRCRIYATDLSDDLVERARRGIVDRVAVTESTAKHRLAGGRRELGSFFYNEKSHAILQEPLRKNLIFSQHNLVSDHSFNEFHLILCRNGTIYFNETLRDRVHDLLYQSLRVFGTLGLGMRESIRFTPHEKSYAALDEGVRLYRRVR